MNDELQVNFRMPTELKKRLADASIDNDRSLTAEIVSRLSHSFIDNDRLTRIEAKLERILERLK